jgi:HEAT repeat protein
MIKALESKTAKVTAALITYLLVLCVGVSSQTNPRVKLLKQLESASWETRASAFYQLIGVGLGKTFDGETSQMESIVSKLLATDPGAENRTRLGLIGLLDRENAVVRRQRVEFENTGKTLTEAYVNYYGDLIAAVGALDDVRSVGALLGAITTGGMATRGLARLGRPALQPSLQELNSADPLTRSAALRVLSEMVSSEGFSVDAASSSQIRDAMVKSLTDQDSNVRIAAVEGVAKLNDPRLRPLIEKLATKDPYQMENTYPVREAATRVLREWQR